MSKASERPPTLLSIMDMYNIYIIYIVEFPPYIITRI